MMIESMFSMMPFKKKMLKTDKLIRMNKKNVSKLKKFKPKLANIGQNTIVKPMDVWVMMFSKSELLDIILGKLERKFEF